MTESILPPRNRTPVKVALDTVADARIGFAPPIRAVKSDKDAPADYLAPLAWEWGIDIWDKDWSDAKKRDVIAQSFELHRLKGTEAGLRAYLALVGADLQQVITHKHKAFASRAISKEQRDAWLARMPQIRVYLVSETGTKGADAFCGSAFAGHAFARLDRAEAIYGRKAVLREPDGTETSLRRSRVEEITETRTAVEYDRVYIPGDSGPAAFVGRFVGRSFASRTLKPAKVVTYALDRQYVSARSELHLSTVSPGLDPIDVKYERISDRGTAGPGLFANRAGRGFAVADRGEWMLYDRVYLFDKTVDTPWIRAHSFAGHSRIGRAPYNAEVLAVAITPKRRRQAHVGHFFAGRAFTSAENRSKLFATYEAARAAKALRDRVKIDTQSVATITFGSRIPLDGSVRFGELQKRSL